MKMLFDQKKFMFRLDIRETATKKNNTKIFVSKLYLINNEVKMYLINKGYYSLCV